MWGLSLDGIGWFWSSASTSFEKCSRLHPIICCSIGNTFSIRWKWVLWWTISLWVERICEKPEVTIVSNHEPIGGKQWSSVGPTWSPSDSLQWWTVTRKYKPNQASPPSDFDMECFITETLGHQLNHGLTISNRLWGSSWLASWLDWEVKHFGVYLWGYLHRENQLRCRDLIIWPAPIGCGARQTKGERRSPQSNHSLSSRLLRPCVCACACVCVYGVCVHVHDISLCMCVSMYICICYVCVRMFLCMWVYLCV